MKKYRRIEIIAFRRRVTIGSADAAASDEPEVLIKSADLQDPNAAGLPNEETLIEPGSVEGNEMLIEAIRILEKRVASARKVGAAGQSENES